MVDWSQVRYDGYAFIAIDVVPAARGARTTLTVRSLADALPGSKQPYTEIDRITLARTAGRGAITETSDDLTVVSADARPRAPQTMPRG